MHHDVVPTVTGNHFQLVSPAAAVAGTPDELCSLHTALTVLSPYHSTLSWKHLQPGSVRWDSRMVDWERKNKLEELIRQKNKGKSSSHFGYEDDEEDEPRYSHARHRYEDDFIVDGDEYEEEEEEGDRHGRGRRDVYGGGSSNHHHARGQERDAGKSKHGGHKGQPARWAGRELVGSLVVFFRVGGW